MATLDWLPTVEWSLKQFVDHAKSVLSAREGDAVHRFLQLVLAGKYVDPTSGSRRVRIIPRLDSEQLASLPLRATRDFDSLIGITDDLPFRRSIAVYPITNFRDRLRKSNHLTRSIKYQVCVAQRALIEH